MKRIFNAALLFCCGLYASAQSLPSQCEAFLPKVLLESKVLEESKADALSSSGTWGQNVTPAEKKYWVAFSDRSNNATYKAPGGSETFGYLSFNEKVRIAKIQNGWALVYNEPNASMRYPKISSDAQVKGWIKMEKLLLWDVCLANEKGIYSKALLCVNGDVQNSSERGYGYTDPNDRATRFQLTLGMKFYFIMKRSVDGKILLATQHNMNDGLTSQVLTGWVSKESYVAWNQRSCIEPTWEHEDVEEFAKSGYKSRIFENESLTGVIPCQLDFKYDANAPYDQYQYRMNPNVLRFPILDGTTSEKYKCSSFTSPSGQANYGGEIARLERQKALLEKRKIINLAIVIDGTQSMDPFFPATKKAILDGCNFFDAQKYDVRVGVLIFRDYADGEVDPKHGLVDMVPLDRVKNVVNNSILDGGSYGIKSSEKTYTEALYYGMNYALDKFAFDKEQCNLMLVIGDCGNDVNDTKAPAQSEIVRKLVEKNVNLVSYQVRNYDMEAWNLFNRQLLQINRQSLQKKYESITAAQDKDKVKVKARIDKNGQYFYNTGAQNDYYYYGTHSYATQGTQISPDVLATLMKNTIKDYSEKVQEDIDRIVAEMSGGPSSGFKGDSNSQEAIAYRMNQEYIKKIFGNASPNGELVGFTGWTEKSHAAREVYKPVLFISSEEFDELLLRLKPVCDVARNSSSDDRKPYVDALKQLLKSMTQGLSDADMANFSISEIMQMIEGLHETSSSMAFTIRDISDPGKVTPAQYRRLVAEFARKYQNLTHIKDGMYKFVRDFNGAKYYWIPIEDLP